MDLYPGTMISTLLCLRKDYDLLIANAKEWLPNPYEMVCAENDENYPIAFAKIQDGSTTIIERMHLHYLGGAYIDVFL